MSVKMSVKNQWWKKSVVYQIYPRSFMDSNGDGIGDINGIVEKLDYLKELGVDVLWLSPVYKSPNDDNGYDISDYQDIMDDFGTMSDFDRMLQEAHKRGLKIMMDLVVNHTSDEHPWFVESRKSKDNPYRDYYIWKDPVNGKEPNNWGACFGGSVWEFDEHTGMYYLHLFSKKQPDLNWENEEVRHKIYDMMNWWCEKGIDGFRMDVISLLSKVQTFPDGECKGGLYGDSDPYICSGPRIHEFLREMNKEVLSKYDLITVGETAGVTIEQAKKYANLDGSELNMVFQFEHAFLANGPYGKWTDNPVPLLELKQVMSKWQTALEGKAWNSLYWDNHDQPRAVSRYGNDSSEFREISAKMLATCLHMMQGTPYIYQGEELGMTNIYFDSIDDYKDIECIDNYRELTESGLISKEDMIRYLGLRGRDNARTPMQWSDSPNAGFTVGTPWIKVNPNYKEINAESQISDKSSVFHYYKKLIQLRKEYDIIIDGHYNLLLSEDERIFAYERILGGQKLLVICNFTQEEAECTLANINEGTVLISNYENHKPHMMQPYEAIAVLYGE